MKEVRLRVLLLNGLVLPGAGHIYLRHTLIGALIASVFSVAGLYLVVRFGLDLVAFAEARPELSRFPLFFSDEIAKPEIVKSFLAAIAAYLFGIIDGLRLTSGKKRK